MKKSIIFFLLLFQILKLDAQTLFQSEIEGVFPATWGGAFQCARQTTDKGYIASGVIGVSFDDNHFFFAKTDSNGNFLWSKLTGIWHDCSAKDIEQTTDGGYIMCGTCYDRTTVDYLILVSRIDSLGNEVWSKSLAGSGLDYANSIKQTFDHGFILTGSSSIGGGYTDILITKLDSSGNIEWSKTYGGIDQENGYSIKQTTDTGFIVSGYTRSFGNGYDLMVLKTDSLGNVSWCKAYSNWPDDWGSDIQQTYDGGYIITGLSGMYAGFYNYSYLIKTDQNGDTLWSKTFGGTDTLAISSVVQTTDSEYVLAGYLGSLLTGQLLAYIIKCNTLGDTVWTKTFSGGNQFGAMANSVAETNDGGYILGCGSMGGYLVKTDANGDGLCYEGNHPVEVSVQPFIVSNVNPTVQTSGLLITGSNYGTYICYDTLTHYLCSTLSAPEIQNAQNEIYLFPNPASSQFTIDSRQKAIKEIAIFNLMGVEIYSASVNRASCIVNCESFPSGIYFVSVINEQGEKATSKVVIMK